MPTTFEQVSYTAEWFVLMTQTTSPSYINNNFLPNLNLSLWKRMFIFIINGIVHVWQNEVSKEAPIIYLLKISILDENDNRTTTRLRRKTILNAAFNQLIQG